MVLIKTGLTLTAFAAAAYSRWLGKKLEAAGVESIDVADLPADVVAKLRRQQMINRVAPLLSGGLVVMGAVEGERNRSDKTTSFARALEKVTDTVSIDKSSLDKVTEKVAGKVGDVSSKVDLHKLTPDFIDERRLPDALSKLAS
jgi:hypothetical protein